MHVGTLMKKNMQYDDLLVQEIIILHEERTI
jgi:hypothetical protein